MTRPLALAAMLVLALAGCDAPAYVDTATGSAVVLPWQDKVEYRVGAAWHPAPPDCIAIVALVAAPGAVGADGAAIVRRALIAAAGLAYARGGDPGRAEQAEADLRDLAGRGVAVDRCIEAIQCALIASTGRET